MLYSMTMIRFICVLLKFVKTCSKLVKNFRNFNGYFVRVVHFVRVVLHSGSSMLCLRCQITLRLHVVCCPM